MSTNSSIEWTDTTWNPVSGCTRASAGCDNCYAVSMTKRLDAMGKDKYKGLVNVGKDHFNGVVKCHEDALLIPLKWRKPRRVFVNSMSDLFHKEVPFEFIDKVFAVMARCPQHTFQILTKRPERMAEYLTSERENHKRIGYSANEGIARPINWPLKNVWLGTSCENQETANERIPHLLKCPAAVRFLSCEPLLGEIDLTAVDGCRSTCETTCVVNSLTGEHSDMGRPCRDTGVIHWVIAGGESGPNARPCVIGHIRSIVKQCKAAGVPVFVKQLGSNPTNREGEKHPISDHHNINEFPEDLRVRGWPR